MSNSNTVIKKEVIQEHATLIHRVVRHCLEPDSVTDLEQILQLAEKNGWEKLTATIRSIMAGNRNTSLLHDLDDEENIIIEAILNGIKDKSTIPPIPVDLQSTHAAAGIASLIHASNQGETESLKIINDLTQQMLNTGDDYSIMAGGIRLMMEGKRDLGKLTESISEQHQNLISDILSELVKLEMK